MPNKLKEVQEQFIQRLCWLLWKMDVFPGEQRGIKESMAPVKCQNKYALYRCQCIEPIPDGTRP